MTTDADEPVSYGSYLALDELLGAQRPRSDEHDELLFIVIHQVSELWFKQLLHELAHLQRRLAAGDATSPLHTLRRTLVILKTLVGQMDVLETLTPRQFAGFRQRLGPASGFQSAQFRELEAVLGGRDRRLLALHAAGGAAHAAIANAMARPALFDSLLRHLADAGYAVPAAALERDVAAPYEPDAGVQEVLLEVYGDEGLPAQICERMVDLDEGVQEWRYRHVKLIERTIGHQAGTGGSAGADFLRRTLFRPAFPDLWTVRSRL
ncbi:MAG TPA: tryptophan 2,3-dioxygenase family protein [Baekduia sp.]|nr:tryptophan 2,3-dioxygenase family protein [Baekduia sp.]